MILVQPTLGNHSSVPFHPQTSQQPSGPFKVLKVPAKLYLALPLVDVNLATVNGALGDKTMV